MKHDCAIVDLFKSKDNVLLVSGDALTVATFPTEEANRIAISGAVGPLDVPTWTIPLAALREVRTLSTGLELTYLDAGGQSARFDHRADPEKRAEFLARIRRRNDGEWHEVRSHESRLVGFAIFFAAALVFAAITAFFLFGIEAGWIQQAPAFVATIYNILGPIGILSVGGLLVAACLIGGVKAFLFPAETISLQRRER